MNVRGIKAALQKKHNDFIASIDDPGVKALVNKNSIITGGSIVSMLLGEEVHDYDYYFTSYETALAVTQYYVKKFNDAHPKKEIEVKVENGRIRVWIQSAGVAGVSPEDESAEQQKLESEQTDQVEKPKYRPVYLTSNAITLSDKVQLVIRFYGDAAEIHSNYDFIHCTCYWESLTGELVTPVKALQAILAKELVYQGSKYPLASVIRTRKFIQRGWTVNAGQYLKMCMQIGDIDLKNPTVLEDQLVGVDMAYFSNIIHQLSERKAADPKFEISSHYVCELVDKIF